MLLVGPKLKVEPVPVALVVVVPKPPNEPVGGGNMRKPRKMKSGKKI